MTENHENIVDSELRRVALSLEDEDSYFDREYIDSSIENETQSITTLEATIGMGLMRLSKGKRFCYIVDFHGAIVTDISSERIDGRKAFHYRIHFDATRNRFKDERCTFDIYFVTCNTNALDDEYKSEVPLLLTSVTRYNNIADVVSISADAEYMVDSTPKAKKIYMSGVDVIVHYADNI